LLAFADQLVDQLNEQVQQPAEEIVRLKDEVTILKGDKKRPTFQPGKLDKQIDTKMTSNKSSGKRQGPDKTGKDSEVIYPCGESDQA